MEFLKELFGNAPLTYDEFATKVQEQKMNIVNLANGGYVSQNKYDDKTQALGAQVKDLQGQLSQRDSDLNAIREQLTAAQADVSKLVDTQRSLDEMKTKYDTDKTAFEERLNRQSYEFAVREKANAIRFTSASAKKAFIQEALGKGFKTEGDKLEGYDEFLTQYKTDDPSAFVAEEPNNSGQPTIVLPNGGTSKGGAHKSLSEWMRAKNENPNIEVNFDE